MPPRILLASALASALATSVPACVSSTGCSAVQYFSGLEVHAGPVDPTTDYAVTADVDGTTLTVHSQSASDQMVQLPQGGLVRVAVSTYTEADGSTQLDIMAENDLETGPASVAITVADATTTLGQQTFTPSYVHMQPDGAGCPSYDYAHTDMSLTP
jgi:hypothetical protein